MYNKTPRVVGQYADNGKPTGKWSRFNEKGKLVHEYSYDNQGRFHGDERFYLKGKLRTHVKWAHGKKHGQTCLYHTNGKKKSCGQYVNDKAHGAWPLWDEQGKLIFTSQYTHGLVIKSMHHGDEYYSVVNKDKNSITVTRYNLEKQKIIRRSTHKPCGPYWCLHSVEEYFVHDKKNGLILKDKLQNHYIIDHKANALIDQTTKKTTPMFCKIEVLSAFVQRFGKRMEACKEHIYPSLQKHYIKLVITDMMSVHRVDYKRSSKGTSNELKACFTRQFNKLYLKSYMKQGICIVRMNMVTTDPQTIQFVDEWSRPPSH